MPPTQTAHHPPWSSWTEESTNGVSNLKRTSPSLMTQSGCGIATTFSKRAKTVDIQQQQQLPQQQSAVLIAAPLVASTVASAAAVVTIPTTTPICLNNNITSKSAQTEPSPKQKKSEPQNPKLQQGKITEYFKSQYKPTSLIKKELSNIIIKTNNPSNPNKYVNLVESNKKIVRVPQKVPIERFPKTRSVPRKILPAPSKQPIAHPITPVTGFPPIITTLIPNVAYIQTKAPKPPDNIFVLNENTIPLVNRGASCIIQSLPNFNCVKLNTTATNATTVVPIVKLNMPSKNYSSFNMINTAVPTVLTASKPNITTSSLITNATLDVSRQCITAEELSPADSGVSTASSLLEVQVDEAKTPLEQAQKSPILSQPKTIRFPAKERTEPKDKITVNGDAATCQWDQCVAQFDTNGALLEHLQVKHVITQANQEQYVCLWHGCKVHGRKSCSRSWLERHVLAHAGSKPFRCIVDGCGQRFSSQLALERHVNGHFNTDSSQNGSTKKSVENSCVKLFRRNGKKIRFRRQPWSARMFDFMDSGIMEGLQYKLLSMTEKRTMGQFSSVDGESITLQSQILARRVEEDGISKMLLRWHPTDVVDDEWVSEKDYRAQKTVSIPKLQPSAKNSLRPVLFPKEKVATTRQKHRRKPSKNT
ncbi:PREDICTED: uncharacterized protein LOC108557589 isoform X2 [Nicrophorus vespilloides]|nr:PREDICTED: uncharacterized protein LOC108557589 isoform X2 [Nicrophorus vespilloides]